MFILKSDKCHNQADLPPVTGSLRTAIKRERWSPATTAHLLEQLAAALTIAHCDIKPDNILLDEEGNAYLADVSIAKDLSLRENPDSMIGTPDYLSPEQVRDKPLTPRTDIYSLGYVLYELLSGERLSMMRRHRSNI